MSGPWTMSGRQGNERRGAAYTPLKRRERSLVNSANAHFGSGNTRRGARAMTLLEVVLAVALLAMVGASMLGAIGAIDSMQMRGRMQLAAAEVGNRLLLTYLHEPKDLPSQSEPLDYGSYKFFYSLKEERVTLELNRTQDSSPNKPQGLSRFKHVTFTMYQAEPGEGSYPVRGEQVGQISRTVDPVAPRNPETVASFKDNPDKINRLIQDALGGQLPTGESGGGH